MNHTVHTTKPEQSPTIIQLQYKAIGLYLICEQRGHDVSTSMMSLVLNLGG